MHMQSAPVSTGRSHLYAPNTESVRELAKILLSADPEDRQALAQQVQDRLVCSLGLLADLTKHNPDHLGEEERQIHEIVQSWHVSRLVHDVFTPTEDILIGFKEHCWRTGIDMRQFSWIGSSTPPGYDPDDPETVVVLDVNLSSLQETFAFAWKWTAARYLQARWWGMSGHEVWGQNPERVPMRPLPGASFTPWTLRWRRIKLNENVGHNPIEASHPEISPGVALLYVAAQHPQRVRCTDNKKQRLWYVPGIECTIETEHPWGCMFYLVCSIDGIVLGVSQVTADPCPCRHGGHYFEEQGDDSRCTCPITEGWACPVWRYPY